MEKQDKMETIQREFHKIGRELTGQQTEQFYQYYEMLIEKNKVLNLTAITDFDDVVRKHFLDSVLQSEQILKKNDAKLIDVGTGAGFPGIPLKILYPELQLALLDSLNKRLIFLQEVTEALGLSQVQFYHNRAEDGARDVRLREQFDYCVSRAVARLSTLAEYCIPFLKVGGTFIAYKSGNMEEELKQAQRAVQLLGGSVRLVIPAQIPDTDIARTLILIDKKKSSGRQYPRKAGMPSKNPL